MSLLANFLSIQYLVGAAEIGFVYFFVCTWDIITLYYNALQNYRVNNNKLIVKILIDINIDH